MKRSLADLHGYEYHVFVFKYDILSYPVLGPIHHGLFEEASEPAFALLRGKIVLKPFFNRGDRPVPIVEIALSPDDAVHLLQNGADLFWCEVRHPVSTGLLSDAEVPGGSNRVDYAVRDR